MRIEVEAERTMRSGAQVESGVAGWQNSCEVYVRGDGHRRILYGLSREEVLADHHLLSTVLGGFPIREGWDEQVVVTPTRKIAMGLSAGWTRGTRRLNAYGDPE